MKHITKRAMLLKTIKPQSIQQNYRIAKWGNASAPIAVPLTHHFNTLLEN